MSNYFESACQTQVVFQRINLDDEEAVNHALDRQSDLFNAGFVCVKRDFNKADERLVEKWFMLLPEQV